uniref:Uncharacterized protein n=1 Tax=Panagrellus redivivus TaxID=6233 RepID=A0A7E4VF97_PANRE
MGISRVGILELVQLVGGEFIYEDIGQTKGVTAGNMGMEDMARHPSPSESESAIVATSAPQHYAFRRPSACALLNDGHKATRLTPPPTSLPPASLLPTAAAAAVASGLGGVAGRSSATVVHLPPPATPPSSRASSPHLIANPGADPASWPAMHKIQFARGIHQRDLLRANTLPSISRAKLGCFARIHLHEENARFLLVGVMLLSYLAVGAVLFNYLERENEVTERLEVSTATPFTPTNYRLPYPNVHISHFTSKVH